MNNEKLTDEEKKIADEILKLQKQLAEVMKAKTAMKLEAFGNKLAEAAAIYKEIPDDVRRTMWENRNFEFNQGFHPASLGLQPITTKAARKTGVRVGIGSDRKGRGPKTAKAEILAFCSTKRSRSEVRQQFGWKADKTVQENLEPLVKSGELKEEQALTQGRPKFYTAVAK
jgi:hypothetical protein